MKISNIMAAPAVAFLLVVALAQPAQARNYPGSPRSQVTEFCGDRYGACAGPAADSRPLRTRAKAASRGKARPSAAAPVMPRPSAAGGFISNALVDEARKYIGTNPTGRGSLWCGAFMDLVLKRTGHAGGGNLASAYARYGTRVAGPQIGAIAVMGRKGGGHVGVVSGIDARGNPIVISGNTWSRASRRPTVLEQIYPRGRIYAYVVPR